MARQLINVQPLAQAGQCPFYVKKGNRKTCFVKSALTLDSALGMVDKDRTVDDEQYATDCGGEWSACAFIPLLYDVPKSEEEEYSPFEASSSDDDNEPEVYEEPEAPPPPSHRFAQPDHLKKVAEERIVTDQQVYAQAASEITPAQVKIGIHRLDVPTEAKCHATAIPVNNLFEIADDEFDRATSGYVSHHLKSRVEEQEINIGKVYRLKSPYPRIKASRYVYACVVAGLQGMSATDIERAMASLLHNADIDGVKVLTIHPFDYGVLDIAITAQAQLTTAYEFVRAATVQSIEQIHFVMQDEETYEEFKAYRDRIFTLPA